MMACTKGEHVRRSFYFGGNFSRNGNHMNLKRVEGKEMNFSGSTKDSKFKLKQNWDHLAKYFIC